jgi:hypothetical protein
VPKEPMANRPRDDLFFTRHMDTRKYHITFISDKNFGYFPIIRSPILS